MGLLIHCWFLVGMDPALMNDLHDPLANAKLSYKGPELQCKAAMFADLSSVTWPAWHSTLSTRTCSYLSSAFAMQTDIPEGSLELHVCGDAFRDSMPSVRSVQRG